MNWKDKRVLVTGAGGFIGSHIVQRLIELDAEVRCFLQYSPQNNWQNLEFLPENIKKKLDIFTSDLRDGDSVREASKDIDIIFHLGALISIPYSYKSPRDVVETNILGTLNILVAAKETNVKKIIHTSTSEVYGTPKYVPINEEHPLQPQSPYSASKIAADQLAMSFYFSYNLPVVIIRPFNTYGPMQSARAVIPTIITQALTSKKISLGSLQPTRDYTYVSDTVEAFIKIGESQKSIGEVINIGSNFEISVSNLVNKIASITGKDIEILKDNNRIRPVKSEVERLICDNSKAKEILGWKPEVSLDDGLKKTIRWISEHLDVYKPNTYNY